MKQKILIAEDDGDIRDLLKLYLESEGYSVLPVADGQEALNMVQQHQPDLAILDIMMPKMNGLELTSRLREQTMMPILILSARGQDQDKILGLNLGADDYIMKPYSVRNVIARVKSVLRRTSASKVVSAVSSQEVLEVEGLVMDMEFKRCTVDGVEVKLTRKEFELLAYLIRHRGKICSREQILNRVWSDEVIVLDRTIDVNITRLRSKIGKYGSYIVTRSGFGYGFRE